MARRSRPLNDEQRLRAARSDPRQASMFGDEHTRELIFQARARQELRNYYAWKYARRDPSPPLDLDGEL
jgi:hypothetical protein